MGRRWNAPERRIEGEMNYYNDRIRLYCKRNGMNQKQFANVIGVNPSTIGKWMRGMSTPPEHLLEVIDRVLEA